MKNSKYPKYLIIFVIAIIYFLAGRLGVALAMPGTNITPVWPPSGIALAAVLLLGHQALYGIFLGSAILNITTLSTLYSTTFSLLHSILPSCLIGIGALLQAALGGFLIQEYIQTHPHDSRITSIIKFLIFGAISCFVNSTIGTLSIIFSGFISWSSFLSAWWTWWVGDSTGIFTVTPLVYAWLLYPPRYWTKLKVLEALLLLFFIALTVWINFNAQTRMAFLFFPSLVWAILRFQLPGATLATFLIVYSVVLETVLGHGPFIRQSVNQSLFVLEIFVIVVTATSLILAAKLSRRSASIFVWHGSPDTIRNLLFLIKKRINL